MKILLFTNIYGLRERQVLFLEINSAGEYSVNIRFVGEDCPVTKIFNVEESLPTFNSETINLCDTYQYTIEMNEFNQASFSWFETEHLFLMKHLLP